MRSLRPSTSTTRSDGHSAESSEITVVWCQGRLVCRGAGMAGRAWVPSARPLTPVGQRRFAGRACGWPRTTYGKYCTATTRCPPTRFAHKQLNASAGQMPSTSMRGR
jgi:hypothetical protein